jgi:hypothetical protein
LALGEARRRRALSSRAGVVVDGDERSVLAVFQGDAIRMRVI